MNYSKSNFNWIRDKLSKENSDSFDETDVIRILSDDWQIERYLIQHQDIEVAYNALIRTLVWKKKFGIHERTDRFFPKEFYETMESDRTGLDRDGRHVYWANIKSSKIHKYSEFNYLLNQFIAHLNEKADQSVHRNGLIYVLDLKEINLSNFGLDPIKFSFEIYKYYPQMFRANLFVGVPAIFIAMVKSVLNLCGPKLSKSNLFIKRAELLDYVNEADIPVEYGGQRTFKPNVPQNVRPLRELDLNLSDKTVDKFYKTYNKLMK